MYIYVLGVVGTRLMVRNEREMFNYLAQLYLRNGSSNN